MMDGVMRIENFLSHHRVGKGTYVGICMENNIEYVIYELALHFIGAVPILLNPHNVASNHVGKVECTAIIVDSESYGHILKTISNWVALEQIFVLTDDISAILIPRNVCVYDGFGYLNFPSKFSKVIDDQYSEIIAFSTSGTSSPKCKIAVHTSQSIQLMCTNYIDYLFDLLKQNWPNYSYTNGVNLITSGLYSVNAWSYLIYSLVKGQTAVLVESDGWRISFLDKIAGLIEQYQIPLISAHTELLNCIVKYDMHNLYDISSLKVIAYSGSSLSPSIAQSIQQISEATVVQAYSLTEFGVVSQAQLTVTDCAILTCGKPLSGVSAKITDLDTDVEKGPREWGRVLIKGKTLFSKYLSSPNDCFTSSGWYRTDDYGMIDEENRLFVGGPIEDIIKIDSIMILPSVLENVLISHASIKDVAIVSLNEELTAGIVLQEGELLPSVGNLIDILEGYGMDNIPLKNIVLVDFIPRSGTGKLIRSEMLFLLESDNFFIEEENSV